MRFRTREGRAASLGSGLWAESTIRPDARSAARLDPVEALRFE